MSHTCYVHCKYISHLVCILHTCLTTRIYTVNMFTPGIYTVEISHNWYIHCQYVSHQIYIHCTHVSHLVYTLAYISLMVYTLYTCLPPDICTIYVSHLVYTLYTCLTPGIYNVQLSHTWYIHCTFFSPDIPPVICIVVTLVRIYVNGM